MSLFLIWKKEQIFYLPTVDFLATRNHLILNQELNIGQNELVNESFFEQNLNLIKKADWLILNFSNEFSPGFELGYFLGQHKTKTILFFEKHQETNLSRFVKGCTFPKFYLKEYTNFPEIRNYLTLHGF